MFCLDFAVAFVAHYAMASHCSEALQSHPVFTFTTGAVAGAVAAVMLYPAEQRVRSPLLDDATARQPCPLSVGCSSHSRKHLISQDRKWGSGAATANICQRLRLRTFRTHRSTSYA